MMRYSLEELARHEEETVLARFSKTDAWTLGNLVRETAGDDAAKITIMVLKNDRIAFFTEGEEATAENEFWADKKVNVVNFFEHSSHYMRAKFNEDEDFFYHDRTLEPDEYAIHGGAFPIRVKGSGIVGVVAVSGLVSDDDHMLCVEALKKLQAMQSQA